MKKGFTLIEVLFAIFILTVSAFGAFSLIQSTLISSSLNKSKLTAYYLSQEGIELVRNIRDGNWLEKRTSPSVLWNDGLDIGEWEIDYNDESLTIYSGRYLYVENNTKFFAYVDEPSVEDEKSKFQRKIIINSLGSEIIEISVIVYWSERGRSHEVEVINHLSNWR
ncbi:MAG: prepilin-type N-terminal cleavage/methylation domain-containing protein [Candidatus Nealsonbacteria bacterium]